MNEWKNRERSNCSKITQKKKEKLSSRWSKCEC